MSDVRFQFVAAGQDAVVSAFKSIGAAARETERSVAAAFSGSARAAQAAATRTEKASTAAYAATAKAAAGPYRSIPKLAQEAGNAEVAAAKKTTDLVVAEQRKRLQIMQSEHMKSLRAEARAEEKARGIQSGPSKFLTSLGDHAKTKIIGGITSAASFATDTVGAAARQGMALQDKATAIAIQARGAGEVGVDAGQLRKGFENTAIKTPGVKAEDVADAVAKYISVTGDAKTAMAAQGTFATMQSASGSKAEEVAAAAAALGETFGVKDIDAMQKSMAILNFQGKQGAFELRDMASKFQRLASAADAFDIGKGEQAVGLLGGLSQIAMKGTGDARLAATAVQNQFSSFTQHSEDLKNKYGVHVYDAKGNKRNYRDVLTETISQVGGNDMEKKNGALAELFGKQGIKGVNPLIAAYTQTAQKTQGTDAQKTAAGLAAMNEMLDKSISTTGNWAEVEKDAATAQQTASAQITGAWETFVSKVSGDLLPEIAKMAPFLGKLVNSGAVDNLITTFVALAQAAGLAIDGLTFIGLLSHKEKTGYEKLQDAEDAKSKFEKTIDPMNMTRAQVEERKRLAGGVDAARGDLYKPASEQFKPLTEEQFAEQFLAAGTKKDGTAGNKSIERDRGMKIAQDISANPNDDSMFASKRIGGIEPAQQKLIDDYSAQMNQNGGKVDAEGIGAAVAKAMAGVKVIAEVKVSTEGHIVPDGK